MGYYQLALTNDQLRNAFEFTSAVQSVRDKLIRAGICNRLRPDTPKMLDERSSLRSLVLNGDIF